MVLSARTLGADTSGSHGRRDSRFKHDQLGTMFTSHAAIGRQTGFPRRDFEQQRHQSQQRDEAVKATTEDEDLLLQVNVVRIGGRQRDDRRRPRREPATCCRSGYSAPDCRVDVLAVADHLSQAMIISALGAGG